MTESERSERKCLQHRGETRKMNQCYGVKRRDRAKENYSKRERANEIKEDRRASELEELMLCPVPSARLSSLRGKITQYI